MKRSIIILLIVFLILMSCELDIRERTVLYEVSCTDFPNVILITTDNKKEFHFNATVLEPIWQYEYKCTVEYDKYIFLSAILMGSGNITATIYVEGVMIATATNTGSFEAVFVDGYIGID